MSQIHSFPKEFIVEELSSAPRVYYFKNFLSHEECDQLIDIAKPKMTRSVTVNPDTGENFEIDSRTSSSAFFFVGENDIVKRIEGKIAHILQRPMDFAEGLQLLNYKSGQEYQPHFDYFDPQLKGSAIHMRNGGQRVATLIMYLSDVEEGGETHLPEINLKVKPQKGYGILFYNLLQSGEVDPLTLHGSLPVIKGEKWGATKWIRERKY